MAVFVSDVVAVQKPALGGSYSGVLAEVSRASLPATGVAVNDEVHLCRVDGTGKALRIAIAEEGTAGFAGTPFNLVVKADDGTTITLATGIGAGTTELFGTEFQKDGILALVIATAPTGASNLVVAVEFFYD